MIALLAHHFSTALVENGRCIARIYRFGTGSALEGVVIGVDNSLERSGGLGIRRHACSTANAKAQRLASSEYTRVAFRFQLAVFTGKVSVLRRGVG